MNSEINLTLDNEDDSLSFLFSNIDYEPKIYKDYTLIMPAVSVGNVGQLAVDLLLTNLKDIRKVTSIIDYCVFPVVGREIHGGLCTCLDVYVCCDEKIVVLQQRAPFVKGRIPRFRKRLVKWFHDSGFRSIIMLGSTSAHIRKDQDISGSPIRYLSASALQKNLDAIGLWKSYTIKKSDNEDEYFLPGSGIIKSVHEDCCREKLAFFALLVFCHPGDNSSEAILLVESLMKYLELDSEEKLQIPLTWKASSKFEPGYVF